MSRRANLVHLAGGICLACVLALSAAACADETIIYPPHVTDDAADGSGAGGDAAAGGDAEDDAGAPADGGAAADAGAALLATIDSGGTGCSCAVVAL